MPRSKGGDGSELELPRRVLKSSNLERPLCHDTVRPMDGGHGHGQGWPVLEGFDPRELEVLDIFAWKHIKELVQKFLACTEVLIMCMAYIFH